MGPPCWLPPPDRGVWGCLDTALNKILTFFRNLTLSWHDLAVGRHYKFHALFLQNILFRYGLKKNLSFAMPKTGDIFGYPKTFHPRQLAYPGRIRILNWKYFFMVLIGTTRIFPVDEIMAQWRVTLLNPSSGQENSGKKWPLPDPFGGWTQQNSNRHTDNVQWQLSLGSLFFSEKMANKIFFSNFFVTEALDYFAVSR